MTFEEQIKDYTREQLIDMLIDYKEKIDDYKEQIEHLEQKIDNLEYDFTYNR